jgi:hypothetical protein
MLSDLPVVDRKRYLLLDPKGLGAAHRLTWRGRVIFPGLDA